MPFALWFLYPSQPADKLDRARVEHYRARLRAGEELPPVLAWEVCGSFGGGGMAVLLDGHHRAAACALEGVRVPCLTLSIPVLVRQEGEEFLLWPDGERTAAVQKSVPCFGEHRTEPRPFPRRERGAYPWPEEYQKAVQRWPTVREAAYLSLYLETELTEAGLRALLRSEEYDETETVAALLEYAARQPGMDIKALALPFAGRDEPAAIREAAYRSLSRLRGDPEIEKLLIDIYVYEEDNLALRSIADRYWE